MKVIKLNSSVHPAGVFDLNCENGADKNKTVQMESLLDNPSNLAVLTRLKEIDELFSQPDLLQESLCKKLRMRQIDKMIREEEALFQTEIGALWRQTQFRK